MLVHLRAQLVEQVRADARHDELLHHARDPAEDAEAGDHARPEGNTAGIAPDGVGRGHTDEDRGHVDGDGDQQHAAEGEQKRPPPVPQVGDHLAHDVGVVRLAEVLLVPAVVATTGPHHAALAADAGAVAAGAAAAPHAHQAPPLPPPDSASPAASGAVASAEAAA